MPHDVFISYASQNKPIADAACAVLESRRARCWIAPRDILPGQNYAEALIEAIENSRVLVLIFSSDANRSPHVMREAERALSKRVVILPLRIEDVFPSGAMEYFVSTTHWLDACTPPLEAHLATLADTVERILGGSVLAPRPLDALSPDFVQQQLSEISQPHVESILESSHGMDGALGEELFVPPAEAADFEAFLASTKRGLVVAGESGAGKSQLLAHFYGQSAQRGGFAAFLTGRLMDSSRLAEIVESEIARRLAPGMGLPELDRFLEHTGQELTLFIDGVNEHTRGGPLQLLDSIVKFVADDHLLRHCRVVASCRTETWAAYRDLHGGPPLDERYFHAWSGDAVMLTGFDDERGRRVLYEKYQARYDLRPRRFAQLDPSAQELIRLPFIMALLAQAYGRRAGETAGRLIPSSLDYHALFTVLTQRKIQDAERLLAPTDAVRLDMHATMEQCLLSFARAPVRKSWDGHRDHGRSRPAVGRGRRGRRHGHAAQGCGVRRTPGADQPRQPPVLFRRRPPDRTTAAHLHHRIRRLR